MKTFKEVAEDIVNKMEEGVIPNTQSAKQKLYNKYIKMGKHPDAAAELVAAAVSEDAPTNSVAGGGVDLAPNAAVSQSPHMIRRKKEQGKEQEKISKKIGQMVKENNDNNSILLKQVLDGLDKVDTKIDKEIYGETEIKVEEEKEYKTFKDKYNA